MVGNRPYVQASEKPLLVWDRSAEVAEWARKRIPYVDSWGHGYQAIGLERRGELIAACVYDHYTVQDIAIHVASDGSKRWMTREALRAWYGYPFHQLGTRRVTAYVASRNEASKRLVEHLGYRLEGVKRDALSDDDLIIYGMTRKECRFI